MAQDGPSSHPALLAGLGVLEFGDGAGVRYAGRLISALGGTVVRVSPPPVSPASFDHWLDEGKAFAPDSGAAAAAVQAAGADLRIAIAGQDQTEVEQAGRALVAADLGDLLRLNLTWFGREGPYASWKGDEAAILALCGLAFGFGPEPGPPALAQGPATQVLGGTTLILAGLAALWGRDQGASGRQVEVSILEAALCFSEHSPPGHAVSGIESTRRGLNRFGLYPATAFPSADGWIGVTAHTPAQWRALADLVGRPDLVDDPRFATGATRAAHAIEVDEALRDLFKARSTLDWLQAGQAARIPLGPMPMPQELLATPHWQERGSFRPLPAAGRLAPGLPFRADLDGRAEAPRPASEAVEPLRPLAGVRVIDFTMGWAGPLATRHLADLGADIVKIESDAHFDWARGFAPVPGSDPPAHEVASAFNVMNRNKRGLSLDLTSPEGVAAAKRLIARADIVIENYGPGVMDRFGLSAAAMRAVRPGLIVVALGAFGATGPWSHFRAYGSTVEQASGLPYVNGEAGWPPSLQHMAFGDPVAGVYGAALTLAALHGRSRVGGGFYDMGQVECLFQLGAEAILDGQGTEGWTRTGSRSASAAPRLVAPAKDGWVAVACPDEASWQALCGVLGRSDWQSLDTPAARNAHADQIEAAVAAWTGNHGPDEAAAALQAAGVPAAPVRAPHELAGDPQYAAAEAFAWMDRAHVGRHMMAAAPYRLDGRRPALMTCAPLLGEHTDEVMGELMM